MEYYIMIDLETVMKKATYIGRFHLHGVSMSFIRAPGLRRKDIIELGDIVYFMVVNGKIYKIGKAGGAQGFAGRAGTYARGRLGDATNIRIMDIMQDLDETEIEVWAIKVPRPMVTFNCPLTGVTMTIPVSIHKDIESIYTNMFLELEENDLPFCHQLS